ncbi:CDP-diacylglycerol--inositol 3-phosphatidyltransferase [Silurus meridionalis]|nr:CDP-diacylglycerol--inositol 3-phosphatidyltransferase [Silurus meridionalis]
MAEENIFLFVPNLIGYARIILGLLSFYLMQCCPAPAVFCYLLSALLDAFDGHAARALNQGNYSPFFHALCTKFGAMLDMLTDRCATMCLLVNLSLLYPSYTFLFQLSMCLDISSHWLHLHSSVIKGATSHKAIDLSGNPILRIYYTSRLVLFFMCMGNELFYCLLYVMYYIEEPQVWLQWLLGVCAVVSFLKSGISVLHLITASRNMAAIDLADRESERSKTK